MAYRWIMAPVRIVVSGEYRSVVFLRLFRTGELHQSTALTWMDRYPKIFSISKEYFADMPDLRILSYGCSTGEEVLTLRSYFPHALIVGVEINRRSLSIARARTTDDRIVFLEALPAAVQDPGPFDAIFCMAVLQRTPMRVEEEGIKDLRSLYGFEKFDEKVTELDSWLKEGGLLVVRHAQYLLSDASVAAKYQPLPAANHIRDTGAKFDRQSMRLEGSEPGPVVYVKMRGWRFDRI